MKHRGQSGNKGHEAARSTAYFVPVHNFLSGSWCGSRPNRLSLSRGTASGSGTNCRRFAPPPGGVTGLSAAKAAVLMKGLWPLTAALWLRLSRSRSPAGCRNPSGNR